MVVLYQIKEKPGDEGHRRRVRSIPEGDGLVEAAASMAKLEDMYGQYRAVFVCYAESEEERAHPEYWRELVDTGDGDRLVPVDAKTLEVWGLL